jgi:hypothetical protein
MIPSVEFPETIEVAGRRIPCRPPRMARVEGPPGDWPVPPLPTPGRLASWLGLTPAELDWFADCKRWNDREEERLRHYRLSWLPKSSGRYRGLEVPKPRLKAIQRKLLDGLVARFRRTMPPTPTGPAARSWDSPLPTRQSV